MTYLASSIFSPEDFLYPEIISKAHYTWDILFFLENMLSNHVFSGIHGTIESGVTLKNTDKIEIAKGAYVESGAYIVGPCILGPQTEVRHGAYIRGNVITGSQCIVGHCTEIKSSYLGHQVKAAHFAYLGDSVLGSNVNLGAGVRCANFRLDGKNICVSSSDKSKKINTGRRKVGAFLGKNVAIGCNVVINPGQHILPNTNIHPGQVI
ncbi:Bifunctional protein GlmU,bifunctional N-acetylglucosamine-1-phosphate uridyltransferase/glucosamine-1-phosphate acetyltransferase,Predicted DNA-binding protein with PD1-like DNA-binding motif,UDP-N-acetylglucosamine diphosphorylase/glucosamine-1-phosphate N-acetyltransferase,Bacterial transferase hexapeptide (six repeats) [Chlamydia serpentis]|uniref:Mannose-1-phosphate guanyltransferase C-terminal domain-containing protein n=1 Tax=Chlamydia serpentis TaxID=1967782 RepID=A0A2R8FBS0_9CHLA|nr:LpxA family transferase [Chlamydia serpentis]SPN73864.1 Bifunctional protein GlmU,bifunctional N-acetylglucosamine-1-phosphate uridyltransferase/glucosamine-1-phosphate acetyltransferase,Predicted DNA-binding protein with PD1-like DNA-binding motif,UDP-N-acetylglucosamine diphosphorylase/glucosamine-1-phosphate N-acetyltransferase,Bacterial transferase hexapeptide (six repeats) [Chlamydia serpentis]